jgi:hypothetical protein
MRSPISVAAFGVVMCCGAPAFGASDVPKPSRADTPLHSLEALANGVPANERECKALATALWLRVNGRNFCIRYWRAGPKAPSPEEALVVIHGDIGHKPKGKPTLADAATRTTDASLQRHIEAVARIYPGHSLIVSRPGMLGSSGHHLNDKRKLLEIRVVAAALDMLKERYGIKRFHFAGHSGGGHTVAGLAQSRSDIGCAAITSGAVAVAEMERDLGNPLPAKHPFYDPVDHIMKLKQRPQLRLFVIADPNDKLVSYRSQMHFVERVKAHRLPITHLRVAAPADDKWSHNIHDHGIRLAVDCSKGLEDPALVAKYESTSPPAAPSASFGGPAYTPSGLPPPNKRDSATVCQAALPMASRRQFVGPAEALLIEEDASDASNTRVLRFKGSVAWAIDMAGEQAAISAAIEVPERSLALAMIVRKNSDGTLPATYTIEMRFNVGAAFPFGAIAIVPGISMQETEQAEGSPLLVRATRLNRNGFLVRLSRNAAYRHSNLRLLQGSDWLSVPLIYEKDSHGSLLIRKGSEGGRVFQQAFEHWANQIAPEKAGCRDE